jgi:hypothetical protein
MLGFVYSKEMTERVRQLAKDEYAANIKLPVEGKSGVYRAQHVMNTMNVSFYIVIRWFLLVLKIQSAYTLLVHFLKKRSL